MYQVSSKIQSFTDLIAWQQAHQLVLLVYQVTKSFPEEEMFGLVSQMRRAVVSISSSIAEGFSRQSSGEKIQFYGMALGSLTEVQNQVLIARDVSYLTSDNFKEIAEQSVKVHKLISGLVKHLRQRAA